MDDNLECKLNYAYCVRLNMPLCGGNSLFKATFICRKWALKLNIIEKLLDKRE